MMLTFDEAKARLDALDSLDYADVKQLYKHFDDYQFDKLKLISYLKKFYRKEEEKNELVD